MDKKYKELIKATIISCKIRDKNYQAEILDHYCTLYESKVTAYNQDVLLESIEKNIQEQFKINKRRIIMTNTIYLSIASCLVLFILSTINPSTNIADTIENAKAHDYDPPYGYPIDSRKISAKYGAVKNPLTKLIQFHKGIDLPANIGENIISVEKGIVVESGTGDKRGNYIIIQHDETYTTRYYHLSEAFVQKGDKIEKNQKIGLVGSTGLSTAPHLHYEILRDGKNVDPMKYLKA